jgi:hypothetical protein
VVGLLGPHGGRGRRVRLGAGRASGTPGPRRGLVAAIPRNGQRVDHRGPGAPGGRAVPLALRSGRAGPRCRRADRSLDGHRHRHSRPTRGGGGAA